MIIGTGKNKGVTLIALVITIIVLIILASISIAALTGDNGLVNQANNAKGSTEYQQWDERIDVAIVNAEGKHRNPTLDDVIQQLIDSDIISEESQVNRETGDITTNEPTYVIEGKLEEYISFGPGMVANKNKEYVDKNGDKAIIPAGFIIVPGRDVISEGLVISDNATDTEKEGEEEISEGNQFVWIPVEDFDDFKREHFGTQEQKWWTGTFVTDKLSVNNLYEASSDGIKDSTEVEKMYKSVKENKGFYVGRYEAGTTAETGTGIRGEVVSKKGANIYNNIGFADTDDMTDETGGAVEVARGMYNEEKGDSVTSTLCYGVQRDAIMRWVQDVSNLTGGKYVQDSTGMGWYSDNYESGNEMHQTGIDLDDGKNKMKNIYDLAGNVYEWTMEFSGTSHRIFRGGNYYTSGVNYPASNRNANVPSLNYPGLGFRVTLYL